MEPSVYINFDQCPIKHKSIQVLYFFVKIYIYLFILIFQDRISLTTFKWLVMLCPEIKFQT